MSLQRWASNGWLKRQETNREEIANLLAIVERDLNDSTRTEVSPDWRFGIAYNAALKLCTILLRAEGYRASHGAQHYRAIAALPLILGESRKGDVKYLDTCRIKRNTVEYDFVGGATAADVEELHEFAAKFDREVRQWLQDTHPELVGST